MAIDNRIGNKVIKNARREDASGTRVDPYPYIGIVKNNLDPTRSGRLQVYIPDLGGPEDDSKNWRTVSYASPFMGYTDQAQTTTERPSTANRFNTVNHTYGLWMVPPDINVQVIVLFVGGDPLRGYFIACVNPNLSHYMLPGLAGTPNLDPESLSATERKLYSKGDVVPVVEFNENTKDFTNNAFYNNNKPIHTFQYNILVQQGLNKDVIRGAISSSSQRESPSTVFGISTPGRPIDDPADAPQQYLDQLNNGKIDSKYKTTKSRKGGHVFVMDDGAVLGEDQLIRLRSATGHQVLLHDTNNLIYIANADGDTWVELSSDGKINVYAANGINFRSGGDINLHSDRSINLNAKQQVNIKSDQRTKIESSTTELNSASLKFQSEGTTEFKAGSVFRVQTNAKLSLKAGGQVAIDGATIVQQGGASDSVADVPPMILNSLSDTAKSSTGQWQVQPNKLSTIVTAAPTHEPYPRRTTGVYFKPSSPGIQPQSYKGAVDATKNAGDVGVQNSATLKDIRNQPTANEPVGSLSRDQTTALMAQLGKGNNYSSVDAKTGAVGKYQFDYNSLISAGYIKSTVTNNEALQNPNSWIGKNGITGIDTFLTNNAEQESAILNITKINYTNMVANGTITSDQSLDDVAGMLSVAHKLTPDLAKSFRAGAGVGAEFFNQGKYAASVLASKVQEINQG